MAKINILSSKIFNRIAAGEVVERPASVVKELIENSIDAKAKNITIEINNGGISSIKITDDGHGIEKNQLKNAILPHATSKISKITDLDDIKTLGFRGEALSSIVSVAKVTICSRPIEQEYGAMIYTEGGENVEISDYPISKGTSITVKNLFFNTPAREKFLKPAKSEENEITATVSRFILGNPDVSFKYIVDGKQILNSFGDGLESAFITVYGVSTIKNCYFINAQKNGVEVCGYVGKQDFTKPNRTHQTVFLNGRYITNQTIASSISNAYAPYLMKRQYPFYMLNISMPSDAVDCNVHPNKIDVRFINNQIVYGALYSIISKVLDGSTEALNIITENIEKQSKSNINYVTHNIENKPTIEYRPRETFKFDTLIFEDSVKEKSNKPQVEDIFEQNKKYLESLEQNGKDEIKQQTFDIKRNLSFVGQALNTFIILEDGIDLYFVDQHAAHERFIFDKLVNQMNNNKVEIQPMLLPYIFSVNPEEFDFLTANIELFNSIGIGICEFGGLTFKINSIPVCLQEVNLSVFISELLSDLNTLKTITLTDLLKEKIAQKACKSAIKAGDKLSTEEINQLIIKLNDNLGLKCPHGRPVAVKISRTELDKWFKRII